MAYAADQTRPTTQSNARSGSIVRFIWHHQAGTNDDATIEAMVSGSRQVSATWTVSPEGRITAVVPEERRPWTSASRADDGALTVECANVTGPPDYGISEASHQACARLAAYALRAYGVPLQRATAANGWRGHMGHNEVIGAFGDGYATACPLHLDIDRIIALASDGGSIDNVLEDDMTPDQDKRLIAVEKAAGDLWNKLGDVQTSIDGYKGVRDGINFVQAQLGAIAGIVAALPGAQAGGLTADQIIAAASKGARDALANLTLVTKEDQ